MTMSILLTIIEWFSFYIVFYFFNLVIPMEILASVIATQILRAIIFSFSEKGIENLTRQSSKDKEKTLKLIIATTVSILLLLLNIIYLYIMIYLLYVYPLSLFFSLVITLTLTGGITGFVLAITAKQK